MAAGPGPMKATPISVIARGEVACSAEEAVTGMDRVGAGTSDHLQQLLGVDVTLGSGLAAESEGLVRQADVQGLPVEVGIDGDGGDAEFLARGEMRRGRRSHPDWRSTLWKARPIVAEWTCRVPDPIWKVPASAG